MNDPYIIRAEQQMTLQPSGYWSLTDEEWCELCFLFVEAGNFDHPLGSLLLADDKPSLRTLWLAALHYEAEVPVVFEFLRVRLQERAAITRFTPRRLNSTWLALLRS